MIARNPKVNNILMWVCYGSASAISWINITYTKDYFLNYMSNGNPSAANGLIWWGSFCIALAMAGYEAVCVGIMFTPQVWGFILKVPVWVDQMPEGQRELVENGIKGAILLGVGLLGWVYWIDIFSTLGQIGNLQGFTGWNDAPNAARFFAIALVTFSEVLFCLGNAAAWLAEIGKMEQRKMREYIQREMQSR